MYVLWLKIKNDDLFIHLNSDADFVVSLEHSNGAIFKSQEYSTSTFKGRVRVSVPGTGTVYNGTVCDDHFGGKEAAVTCRMLNRPQ